jgi:hypothetical protein
MKETTAKKRVGKGKGNKKTEIGGGPNSGGGEGFESGSESHMSTIECHVTSSSPHSQGD